MTQMRETQSEELPKNEEGRMYFDAAMCDWNDGNGPDLSINIPEFFEGGDGSVYDGFGVVTVPLQDVLNDYLKELKESDGGVGVPKFPAWLRDYADRLEAASKE